jgi:SAM-dependent methyltransferase
MADTPERIRQRMAEIVRQQGPWTAHTIHLGAGVYTIDDPGVMAGNAARIRRFLQITADLAGKPLDQLRVLDLACLEGQYGIELALHGAEVVGVEIRDEHIAKARFAAETLGLDRVDIRKDDVRNLSVETYGKFDVVLCIGILYHLDSPDVFEVIRRMADVCTRLLVIDTHISNWRGRKLEIGGRTYRGRRVFEHFRWTTAAQRAKKPWASIDNPSAVWLSRASLENALQEAGFTSVYDCGVPSLHEPRVNRGTFVAVKGIPVTLRATPAANGVAPLLSLEPSLVRTAANYVKRPASILRGKLRELLKRRRRGRGAGE